MPLLREPEQYNSSRFLELVFTSRTQFPELVFSSQNRFPELSYEEIFFWESIPGIEHSIPRITSRNPQHPLHSQKWQTASSNYTFGKNAQNPAVAKSGRSFDFGALRPGAIFPKQLNIAKKSSGSIFCNFSQSTQTFKKS